MTIVLSAPVNDGSDVEIGVTGLAPSARNDAVWSRITRAVHEGISLSGCPIPTGGVSVQISRGRGVVDLVAIRRVVAQLLRGVPSIGR